MRGAIRAILIRYGLTKKRVIAFVDGFNVYHFLDRTSGFNKYKWLDYRKLSECYTPTGSILKSVYYFTALATWEEGKVKKHNVYIRALRTRGVIDVVGKFKRVKRTFVVKDLNSTRKFKTYDGTIKGRFQSGYTFEEKKTDVNIASHILALAAQDAYDTALLFSGDTDFEPAIEQLRKCFPKKSVIVVVPNRRIAGSLRSLVGKSNCLTLDERFLRVSQLNDPLVLADGTRITRPTSWI